MDVVPDWVIFMEYTENNPDIHKAISLMQAGTPVIIFDLETTGLDPVADRIVQIGAMKMVMRDGLLVETDSLDELVDPGIPIPQAASEHNHITDEMVAGHMKEDGAYRRFREFAGPLPLLCGFNSRKFDEEFIKSMYLRQGEEPFKSLMHMDVLLMARQKLDLRSYTLEKVSEELGCGIGIRFHNALDDVKATCRVLQELLPMFEARDAALPVLEVEDCGYWYRSHYLERIYINTFPDTKSYYDVYRKKWVCDMDVDMQSLRKDALRACGASDETEMVRSFRQRYRQEKKEAEEKRAVKRQAPTSRN